MNEIIKIMPVAFCAIVGSGISAYLIWKTVEIISTPKQKKLEVITKQHRKLFNLK